MASVAENKRENNVSYCKMIVNVEGAGLTRCSKNTCLLPLVLGAILLVITANTVRFFPLIKNPTVEVNEMERLSSHLSGQ